MGTKPMGQTLAVKRINPAFARGVLLAVFFLLGSALGWVYASGVDSDGLRSYLTDYCTAVEEGISVSLGSCVILYFSYGVLVFLLGFASVGTVLIPLVSALYGFLTMYAISCFTFALGREGAVLALAVLGPRLVFTLPCFLTLASSAWPLAIELAMLSLGKGKRGTPVIYGKSYFLLFVLCVVILSAGVLCERFLTPALFRLALDRVAMYAM